MGVFPVSVPPTCFAKPLTRHSELSPHGHAASGDDVSLRNTHKKSRMRKLS